MLEEDIYPQKETILPVTMKWTTISLIHDGTLSVYKCALGNGYHLCTASIFLAIVFSISLSTERSVCHPLEMCSVPKSTHTRTHTHIQLKFCTVLHLKYRSRCTQCKFGWFWRFDIVSFFRNCWTMLSVFGAFVLFTCSFSKKKCILCANARL